MQHLRLFVVGERKEKNECWALKGRRQGQREGVKAESKNTNRLETPREKEGEADRLGGRGDQSLGPGRGETSPGDRNPWRRRSTNTDRGKGKPARQGQAEGQSEMETEPPALVGGWPSPGWEVAGGPHLCTRLACMGQGSSREGRGSCSSFCADSVKAWMLLSSSSSSRAPQGRTPGPRYRRVAALGSSLSTEDSEGPGAGGQTVGRAQEASPQPLRPQTQGSSPQPLLPRTQGSSPSFSVPRVQARRSSSQRPSPGPSSLRSRSLTPQTQTPHHPALQSTQMWTRRPLLAQGRGVLSFLLPLSL